MTETEKNILDYADIIFNAYRGKSSQWRITIDNDNNKYSAPFEFSIRRAVKIEFIHRNWIEEVNDGHFVATAEMFTAHDKFKTYREFLKHEGESVRKKEKISWLSEHLVSILSLLVSIVAVCYSIRTDKQNEKFEQKLKFFEARIAADSLRNMQVSTLLQNRMKDTLLNE